ncbi:TIGR04086 family membrane protein [Edaphovirga cremea]|uniref:TIGR04086 family membrane protein n=1 Tax=Edaphovirga cremea TaxID=2267246 RepID=UPI003988BC06
MTDYDVNSRPVTADGYINSHSAVPLKRISWSAVMAGVILSIVAYILIAMLGTAIGAGTIDPLKEQNPLDGIGIGAGIWMIANMLISCAIGGYVAGRLAQREGALHGVLMWGVNTLICAWLIVVVFSSAISGAANIAGSGLQAIGSGISSIAPRATQMAKEKLQENNINLDQLQNELETTLRQTGKPQLQPENLQGQVQSEANNAQNQAQATANHPQTADTDVAKWLQGVISRGDQTLQAADRDALKNIIKARTGKTDAEVEQIVQQAEKTYQQAYQKYQELKAEAEQKAREAADEAAAATAKASWFSFFLLIIGGVIAGAAGALGRRTQPHRRLASDRPLK